MRNSNSTGPPRRTPRRSARATSRPGPAAHPPARTAAAAADVEHPTAAAAALGRLAADLLGQTQAVIIEHEEELGNLDAIAGDGDHGIGMRRGMDAAVTAAGQALDSGGGASPSRVLTAAGEAWSERAGGTSGALWGSAVIAAGLALGNRETLHRRGRGRRGHRLRGRDHRTRQGRTRATKPWWTRSCRSGTPSSPRSTPAPPWRRARRRGRSRHRRRRRDLRAAPAQGPRPPAGREEPRPPRPRRGLLRTDQRTDRRTRQG